MTNRSIVPLGNYKNIMPFSDGMARVSNEDEMWGYINDKGEVIYDCIFDDAEDFNNGTAKVIYQYKNRTVDKKGGIR